MFCRKCGAQNQSDAAFCESCGESIRSEQPSQLPESVEVPRIDTHLVEAILAAIFCCQIPGIVAIVYAVQADGKLKSGDYAGAEDAANTASGWAHAAMLLGIIGAVIALVAALIGHR